MEYLSQSKKVMNVEVNFLGALIEFENKDQED